MIHSVKALQGTGSREQSGNGKNRLRSEKRKRSVGRKGNQGMRRMG